VPWESSDSHHVDLSLKTRLPHPDVTKVHQV
jgi:hypothetical protein